MQIKILAFGIARDIMQTSSKTIDLRNGSDIAAVKAVLIEKHPQFLALQKLSFAVNEDYQEDDFELRAGDEVVIIPPVSGG